MRFVLVLIVLSRSFALGADEPTTQTAIPLKLSAKRVNDDWRLWEAADPAFSFNHGKFLCMSEGQSGEIWIGTSFGRLLSMTNHQWILQSDLQNTRITSIATAGPKTVWLSTSDGLRLLERDKNSWKITSFRTYFQGQPGFFSGPIFVPNADAMRSWGCVDRIYVPSRKKDWYEPFVISNEHGIFLFQQLQEIWHHYLPHFWGANSPWLDTRELAAHRRPTCIVEDVDTNIWIGTQWDGIVRLNAHARDYWKREPDDNKKDGTEFGFFDSKTVGAEFDEVVSLSAGLQHGVWAILALKDQRKTLARFDGKVWTTMSLPDNASRINCITEIKPGKILVGFDGGETHSIASIDWSSKKIEYIRGPQYISEILSIPDGRILAASEFGLYEKQESTEN